MPSAPCTLDYFKLGCAAGNYIVIFTSKGVRGQLLEALRRVQLAGNPLMQPITDLLESFPDEVPDTPLPWSIRESCPRI